MGAKYLCYVKSIATFAPTFYRYIYYFRLSQCGSWNAPYCAKMPDCSLIYNTPQMFIEKNRDSPLSTGSISTVPSSIWFFRFSNDKIFENPAGEKNSQKYLNDFIKELDSTFKRQNLSKASNVYCHQKDSKNYFYDTYQRPNKCLKHKAVEWNTTSFCSRFWSLLDILQTNCELT